MVRLSSKLVGYQVQVGAPVSEMVVPMVTEGVPLVEPVRARVSVAPKNATPTMSPSASAIVVDSEFFVWVLPSRMKVAKVMAVPKAIDAALPVDLMIVAAILSNKVSNQRLRTMVGCA